MIKDNLNELRVLIFAPSGRDALLAQSLLTTSNFTTRVCNTSDELIDELRAGAAAALLSSETLTPSVISRLSDYLIEQPAWSDLSIIVFVGTGSTASRRQQNKMLGTLWNATILERPVRAATLVNMVEIAVRARKRQYMMRDHLVERTMLEERLEVEYRKQFRIAETLQRSMINMTPMRNYRGIDVETLYLSAKDEADVGGDFFDVFPLDQSTVAIVVGDVSGKGLEAAVKSLEVKYPLRAFLRQSCSPQETLVRLNNYLLTAHDLAGNTSGVFVCVAICVINTAEKLLTWCTAGFEGPFIVLPDGSLESLARVSPPIGVMDGDLYEQSSRPFSGGETLLIFTDGVTEARNDSGFFGVEGVAETLSGNHSAALSDIISHTVDAASAFSEGVLADDVCIVAARLDGQRDTE